MKMHDDLRRACWLALALAATPNGGAIAQSKVEEITVTATRTAERVIDVPVITEVIRSDDIEMSGSIHLGDLLAKFTTGHYHKYNGLYQTTGLRGYSSDAANDISGDVLVLIDGHRVGSGNTAKINMDRIDTVEVTKGPASALYGSAAMGGVINMITKRGSDEPETLIGLDIGSFEYYKAAITRSGQLDAGMRYVVSLNHEDFSDYEDPRYGTVYNTGETKSNIGWNLTFPVGEARELRFGGNYADLTGEYPRWLNGTYSTYNPDYAANYDKSHGYLDLEYNSEIGERLRWKGMLYYLWDYNHWFSGTPDPMSSQSENTDITLGTDHQLTYDISDTNTLVFGVNIENIEKETAALSNYLPSYPSTPGMEYDSSALFVQDSIDLADNRINVIVAGRMDKFDVVTKPPSTGQSQAFNERNETYSNFSPKAGIGIKFADESLRLRMSLGEGFHSPSARELSSDYISNTGRRYLGNPDLRPETTTTYELGFDVFADYLTIKTTYFNTDYQDAIVQTTSTIDGIPTTTWVNHGEATMAGIDFNVDWSLGRIVDTESEWTLWFNSTLNTDAKDEETNEDLLYVSDYELKSGLRFAGARGLNASVTYTLTGPQLIQNFDNNSAIEQKDSFSFWDLSISKQINDRVTVRGNVLNVFNDYVEWVRGYGMAERNFRASVSFAF